MNSNIDKLKQAIIRQIETDKSQLRELSLKIHDNPELGLHEFKAGVWLTEYLASRNFTIEREICEMPTSFRATYGKGKPRIGLLAEYDALPGVGHACGHNLICTIAVGAAAAAKKAVDQYGGSVVVIGTPAEENYGGKIVMSRKGAFDDLDAAMLVHPDSVDIAAVPAIACQQMNVEFFGKSSHASANPAAGINALDAMILSFNNINALRQQVRSDARIHGIITDGGQAANIIPAHTAGEFYVRAADDDYLDELLEKVLNCFVGAALATGARLEYKPDELRYAGMHSNMILAQLYVDNMHMLGREVMLAEPVGLTNLFSTDMGNVSQRTAAIHAMVAIAPPGISPHTAEFAAAAASEAGFKGMYDAAKAVAMTVVDLLTNAETMQKVRAEFEQGKLQEKK
jgi:amidohydrolase